MIGIELENGVSLPPLLQFGDGLPLDKLKLGRSIWIPADDPQDRAQSRSVARALAQPDSLETGRGYVIRLFIPAFDATHRARWRRIAELESVAHRLTTWRGYLVQSIRTGTLGVRIWLISLPAKFIPIGPSSGNLRSARPIR